MPIRPENKNKYPDDWKQIREKILTRAGHCCEFCGVKNYTVGFWNKNEFIRLTSRPADDGLNDTNRYTKIVLTIAHLDHHPENNDPNNLRALCQRCHNRHDSKHRQETKKYGNESANQLHMFE